jgi:ribosomal protein S14
MITQQYLCPPPLKDLSTAEARFMVDHAYGWNDMAIDTNELAKIPLGNFSLGWSSQRKSVSLGQFEHLSPELIYAILENTDLFSIMRLRATNSSLRGIINDWTPFSEIMTHGGDVIRALLATKAAPMFTVPHISKAIFQTRCEFCGDCGTFLQLLKLARCCFRCLANDRRLLSVPLSFVQTEMGIDPKHLPKIPHFSTIPRAKFVGIEGYIPSCCAVDYTTALEFSPRYPVPGDGEGFELYMPELPTIIQRRHQKAKAAHRRQAGSIKRCGQKPKARPLSSYPITTVQPLAAMADISPPENPRFRFLSAMHAPGLLRKTTLNPQTNNITHQVAMEDGHYCSGCRFFWNLISPRHPREHTIYTETEIATHLQICFYARLRWNQLYPPDQPVDEARTVRLLHQRPGLGLLRNVFPGFFEIIPVSALRFYEQSNPIDKGYGELLLGSSDATSQAVWATSSRTAAGNLWRYIYPMLDRKGRKGDISPWVQAAGVQIRRPPIYQRAQCQNGLPTSRNIHPPHTQTIHHNGQAINVWSEPDNTQYSAPWFLDHLSR